MIFETSSIKEIMERVHKGAKRWPTIRVTKAGSNPGFCREYYRGVETGTLYCLQEDNGQGKDKTPYICTQDGEPSHKIDAILQVQV